METISNKKNKICFGLGTIGRDMFYSMVSTYAIVYFTEVRDLSDNAMWWMTIILTVLRVFDAVNDPVMGVLVDNTRSEKWGKYKPWMGIGAVVAAVFMLLMFNDFNISEGAYVVLFAVSYILWDVFYGANDIAYWAMMPSLSLDQKERERIGSFARICANIGMFTVVVAIIPVTNMMTSAMGGDGVRAWFVFAVIIAVLLLAFQSITVFGVKEHKGVFKQEEHTSLKDMFKVIFKNDQLLIAAVSMALFSIGYFITTSFGVHFFKYAYKNEGMYSIFAVVLGVSQLAALAVFPAISKKYTRKQLYSFSTVLIAIGYIIFFFSPMNMLPIGIAGVLIFVGEAFIQLMMYMFVADTIEYGQWKSGKRNESITFSAVPFINKIAGAVSSGIVSATLIISGINSAKTVYDVSAQGLTIMKIAMLVLPIFFIAGGYLLYKKKYIIDSEMYDKIVRDLKDRGEIKE